MADYFGSPTPSYPSCAMTACSSSASTAPRWPTPSNGLRPPRPPAATTTNHAETDKAVRAIVVTGTGKVFCAGEDLSELSEGGECQTVTEHGFGGLTARLCSKPVICACNGSAAGRPASRDRAFLRHGGSPPRTRSFGCTEVGLGIIASSTGRHRAPARPRHQPQGLHGASAHRQEDQGPRG